VRMPQLVQGAGGWNVPANCDSDTAQIWLLLFVVLAIANFILQDRYFVPRKNCGASVKVGNATLLAIFIAALCFALAFEAYIEMLSWWINLAVYVVSFAVMVLCVRLAALRWSDLGKWAVVIGTCFYWAIFGTATANQYERQHEIDLVFKTSVSVYRAFITRHDLSESRVYFQSINMLPPKEALAVGIRPGYCFAFANPQSHQAVLPHEIWVGGDCLTRQGMTMQYSAYVVDSLPHEKGIDSDGNHFIAFIDAKAAFATYFNWSFWNRNLGSWCPGSSFGWATGAEVLWKIRERLGGKFTDDIAAYAIRLIIDDPLEDMNNDPMVYLARKLKKSESVVDDGTNWPIILGILKGEGVKIENI
jgi:hypothetical protein